MSQKNARAKRHAEPLIGLVMIGKNEAEQVGRCLESVLPLIDTWTYCDTGSTDDTIAIVRDTLKGIPGRVYRHTWKNYGHNRTLALARAKGTAKWLTFLDCDMTVETDAAKLRRWLLGRRSDKTEVYQVNVSDHAAFYMLPLLIRGNQDWRYVGATHEYLDISGHPWRPLTGIYVVHHSDGSNREDKMTRDIELLKPDFQKGDPRAIFYTAQSYRYLGHDTHAAAIYDLRSAIDDTDDSPLKLRAPDFEEERWYSSMQAAALRRDVDALIEVWRERPWRHEPLLAAARIVAQANPDGGGDLLFREPLPDSRPTL